jgi:hypothetical protein
MPVDISNHPQNFIDRPQQIWICVPKPGTSGGKLPILAHSTQEAAALAYKNGKSQYHSPEESTLHRPSLQPIYGGPTLLEALWNEMDRLMEGLMTGTDAEDGGDRYRAQELAWVLAIVTNAYNPSVDRIRAEAMRRWNEQQEGADR